MNEHLLEKIDDFLEGRLSEQEKLLFEAELQTNEALSSLLNTYKGIEGKMRDNSKYSAQQASLQQTLAQLNAVYFTEAQQAPAGLQGLTANNTVNDITGSRQPGKIISINWRSFLLVAACAGLIVAGAAWYLKHEGAAALQTPQVAKNRYKKADSLVTPLQRDTAASNSGIPLAGNKKRTDSQAVFTAPGHKANAGLSAAGFTPDAAPEDIPEELAIAFDHYVHREYQESIKEFEHADQHTRGEDADKKLADFYRNYYLAQNYLAKSQAAKAVPALNTALNHPPDSFWEAKTQWYLALAYIKTGDEKKAAILLNKVANNKQAEKYRQQAEKMITQLKEKK